MFKIRFIIFSLIFVTNSFSQNDDSNELIQNRLYNEFGIEFVGTQNGWSVGPKVKLGGNIYFMDRYSTALGINVNIISGSFGFLGTRTAFGMTPAIGPSYIVRLTENSGMEFNLPLGYGGYVINNSERAQGFTFMPEAKWRLGNFSIGVHYTGIMDKENFGSRGHDSFGLSFGFKFNPEQFFNNLSTGLWLVL